mgnify:CR=1 FL=1
MLYHVRALKNGQCQVRDYITFGDRWDESPRLYFLYIWLIEGADRPIVVDTGPKDIEAFNRATQAYIPVGITQEFGESTVEALAKANVDCADVGYVFLTHMHPDHCSNWDLFPNAKIVVSEHAFPDGAGPDRVAMAGKLILVGDTEVLPGIRTFHLGCHSADSQGIAIDTAKGTVVLSGDVAYMFENIEVDRPIRSDDIVACREALRILRSKGDIILPGHDPLILERYPDGIIA